MAVLSLLRFRREVLEQLAVDAEGDCSGAGPGAETAGIAVVLLGILLLAGLALLWAAFTPGRCAPRATAWLVPLLLLLLVARATLAAHPTWEWACFPWPSYAYVQGFLLHALAAPFLGLAAALLPVRWNRAVVLLVGVAVLLHGARRHAWLAWPETHGDTRTADARHHLQQSTHYTCGPAACAAVLSHCGVTVSEREMARLCLTRTQGSSIFDLYRGLVCALAGRPFRVSIEDLTAAELGSTDQCAVPANAGEGHALGIAVHGGEITVHDPLQREPETWSME